MPSFRSRPLRWGWRPRSRRHVLPPRACRQRRAESSRAAWTGVAARATANPATDSATPRRAKIRRSLSIARARRFLAAASVSPVSVDTSLNDFCSRKRSAMTARSARAIEPGLHPNTDAIPRCWRRRPIPISSWLPFVRVAASTIRASRRFSRSQRRGQHQPAWDNGFVRQ